MSLDLHASVTARPALDPQTIATDTATRGPVLDTSGFKVVEFVLQSGAIVDGTFTPSILAADATAGNGALVDGVEVPAGGLRGTIAGATFVAASDAAVKRLGYRGGKRFVQLAITSTGTTQGGALGAIALLAEPDFAPVA